jgi:hypothetical protein
MTSGSYIGEVVPGTVDYTDKRLDFIGPKAEVQAYLDNVRFYRGASGTVNESAFDMYFTITNGVVGSTVTKTCYFSDAIVGVSTIPSQSFTEDSLATWDFDITTSNVQPDADTFKAEITLDSVGRGGVSVFTTGTSVTSQSYTAGTGVLEIIASSDSTLVTALRNLVFEYEQDFDTGFDMTVDLTYSSSSSGATYSSTQQTVVVGGIGADEINNPTTSHTYTEDTVYDFSNGTYPQIIHAGNESFDIDFTITTAAGTIGTDGTAATWTDNGSGSYTLSGTTTNVNTDLALLYYAPTTDYNSTHSITFTVDRTTGNQEHDPLETGSFTMTGTAVGEYSITQLTNYDWYIDNYIWFDTGLAITDTSTDESELPEYGSTYTVEIAMFEDAAKNTEYTDGTIVANTTTGLVKAGAGNENGQGDTNMISYTGSKINVNNALADMKFSPDCGEDTGPYINYKLIRNSSTPATFTDQSSSTRTEFNTGDATDYTFTYNPSSNQIDWNEDTPKDFDSALTIVDGAATHSGCSVQYGSTYTATITAYDWDDPYPVLTTGITLTSTSYGSATLGGTALALTITGTKADVNTALANLRMTPDMDFTDAPSSSGKFFINLDIERNADTFSIVDDNIHNEVWIGFNSGTTSTEYYSSETTMVYTEDAGAQSIFSGKDIGITDVAADNYANITYEVTITLGDSNAGEWTGTGSHIKTLTTDTKANVNTAIQALTFTPAADYNTDIDILYTQKRYVSAVLDTTHATNVTVGTVTGTDTAEFTYGTANSNIQYYVPDAHITGVDTTDTLSNILDGSANVTLTPKQISLNKGLTYDRPITVVDTYEDGGASQYKIVFSGGTLPVTLGASLNITDTGWQTKTDLHTILDDGIYVTDVTEALNNYGAHDATYTSNFTLHRKSYTGTEAQFANGSLTYKFQTGLKLWHYEYPNTETRIDDTANGSSVTLDVLTTYPNGDMFYFKPSSNVNWSTSYGDITIRVMNVTASPDEWSVLHTGTSLVADQTWDTYYSNFFLQQRESTSSSTSDEGGSVLHPQRRYNTSGYNEQISVKAWTPWGAVLTSGQQGNTPGGPFTLHLQS